MRYRGRSFEERRSVGDYHAAPCMLNEYRSQLRSRSTMTVPQLRVLALEDRLRLEPGKLTG